MAEPTARSGAAFWFFVLLLVVTIAGSLVLAWDMTDDDKASTDQLEGPERTGLFED